MPKKISLLFFGGGGNKLFLRWSKEKLKVEEKQNYKSFNFSYNLRLKENQEVFVEIEIRQVDEKKAENENFDFKSVLNSTLGAFVFYTNEKSLKWRQKLGMLISLPNEFPLPIILISDKHIENIEYIWKREMFFNYYQIDIKDNIVYKPLDEMISILLNFKDIREKVLSQEQLNIIYNKNDNKCILY